MQNSAIVTLQSNKMEKTDGTNSMRIHLVGEPVTHARDETILLLKVARVIKTLARLLKADFTLLHSAGLKRAATTKEIYNPPSSP